jgi:diguanylate cyclase (GGDEF)-like protein
MGLILLHSAILLLGAVTTWIGDGGQAPPVLSLFGLIHFESIVFALGTAVFLLAMVKERNEAAGLKAARVDPLTGIANRSGFADTADRVFARCAREGSEVSVMMFDLDRFKTINDSHGHAVGDAVIRKFCELAAAGLRPNDVFGRLGGEEFAVVLPGASIEVAYIRAERIRAAVAWSCRTVDGYKVSATVSCGVAGGPAAGLSLEALIEEADAALYRAKAEGRNRVWRGPKSTLNTDAPNVIRVA